MSDILTKEIAKNWQQNPWDVDLHEFTQIEDEAAKIFGKPRGFPLDANGKLRYGLEPLPVKSAQEMFMQRFEAIEALREAGNNPKSRQANG